MFVYLLVSCCFFFTQKLQILLIKIWKHYFEEKKKSSKLVEKLTVHIQKKKTPFLIHWGLLFL